MASPETSSLNTPPVEPWTSQQNPEDPKKPSKGKKAAFIAAAVVLAAGSTLAVDYGIDGEPDILQSIGLANSSDDIMTEPVDTRTHTPTPSPSDTAAAYATPTPPPSPAVTEETASTAPVESAEPTPESVPTVGSVDTAPRTEIAPEDLENVGLQVEPNYVSMHHLGLNIPIINQGLEHRGGNTWAMKLPTLANGLPNSDVGGWLNTSAPLNSEAGTTTIASHVNYWTGPQDWAPMHKLYSAHIGDSVEVSGTDGNTYKWEIIDKVVLTQDELSSVIKVEDKTGPRQLVMVTCHTDANGNYTNNLVVTAVPAD